MPQGRCTEIDVPAHSNTFFERVGEGRKGAEGGGTGVIQVARIIGDVEYK